ncbi:TetR/AcrR family transcriptional regulator [Shewanella waksmanii]|uniref:TetR/AcrR family transcriptional regulator n=1 Tax=Shewanella waksmanii TaxID=213783 RepID=UPI00048CBDB8|nr:TetR family transcriptional regulator [Shewanella waksmanii]
MEHGLRYLGKQTSRSDGETRRVAILEATLRVIVREGIRGVRHRAIAEEAQVPLASTTYYFSDIKILISDALTYFAEKTLWMNKALEEKAFAMLATASQTQAQALNHSQLASVLTEMICLHITEQVSHRDDRILESAFHEEALRNQQLADAIKVLDDSFISTIERFFVQLGSADPLADAHQVLAIIKLLEYRAVVNRQLDADLLQRIVSRSLENILQAY